MTRLIAFGILAITAHATEISFGSFLTEGQNLPSNFQFENGQIDSLVSSFDPDTGTTTSSTGVLHSYGGQSFLALDTADLHVVPIFKNNSLLFRVIFDQPVADFSISISSPTYTVSLRSFQTDGSTSYTPVGPDFGQGPNTYTSPSPSGGFTGFEVRDGDSSAIQFYINKFDYTVNPLPESNVWSYFIFAATFFIIRRKFKNGVIP